ncbi:MAG: AAA family ATPase, partial [Gammaproteobacteria bacterium]|nr:AAA family ATPase [Gammaproteobacteria bacterium]
MSRRGLPIGIQTFREIREAGHYYVDKTPHIERLVDDGKHFFLSRPRRFGKSLFLDTLKALFEGGEELFDGLAIHERWDWSVRNPVVRLDFSKGDFTAPDYLHRNAMAQLDGIERRSGIVCEYDTAPERLSHLLETMHERTGQRVVVLVDEYDKPILDALGNPEVARAHRDYLRGLYSTLKFADAHIRLSFITGVSKFSKVSLFSGLNNLIDITMDPAYSAICGYTERDLDEVFSPELEGLDRQAIREWYNGYSWLG